MDSIIIKRGLRNEHRLTDWQENLSSFTHKHEEVPVNTFRCTDLGYKARWQPLLLVSLEVFDLEQRSYLLSALTQSHGRTFTLAVSPSHTHTHTCVHDNGSWLCGGDVAAMECILYLSNLSSTTCRVGPVCKTPTFHAIPWSFAKYPSPPLCVSGALAWERGNLVQHLGYTCASDTLLFKRSGSS